MIKLKLKDDKIKETPDIVKWMGICEDKLNKVFPPERLDSMRREISLDLMLYGTSITDGKGNRVDPNIWGTYISGDNFLNDITIK